MDTSLFVRYFQEGNSRPPPPVLKIPGFVHPVTEHYLEDLDAIFCNSKLTFSSSSTSQSDFSYDEDDEGNDDDYDDNNNDISDDDGVDEGGEQEETCSDNECKMDQPRCRPSIGAPPPRVINLEQKYRDHRVFPLIAKTVLHADKLGTAAGDDGAILVFMSGIGEISRALAEITQLAGRLGRLQSLWLLPLHGSLTAADQQKVFQRPKRGMRKVVVCTNVAETSITIDDCVYVIDSGKMKEMQYEAEGRLSALVEKDVSAANARQRRGRAGRVRPGHCFRLFTRAKCEALPAHQTPEIHREFDGMHFYMFYLID